MNRVVGAGLVYEVGGSTTTIVVLRAFCSVPVPWCNDVYSHCASFLGKPCKPGTP